MPGVLGPQGSISFVSVVELMEDGSPVLSGVPPFGVLSPVHTLVQDIGLAMVDHSLIALMKALALLVYMMYLLLMPQMKTRIFLSSVTTMSAKEKAGGQLQNGKKPNCCPFASSPPAPPQNAQHDNDDPEHLA